MASSLGSTMEALPRGTVLVIGGGIGGMRAALDLADAGLRVYLIEQTPCLGGRVAQLGYMFPQHDCVLCRGTPDHGYGCTRPSISPAYIQHNQHPNIQIITNAYITDVAGQAGDFTISLRQDPRYVDIDRCISCGKCEDVCPIEQPNTYQQGMTKRKAIYKVATRAAPDSYVLDRGTYCDECGRCVEVCPGSAIDLNAQSRLMILNVGAVILAVGFHVYDPTEMEELGYGRFPNVVQAMHYERLASRSGPTEGKIVRPSDAVSPRSIAWLQCIGSRDKQYPFCSSICCMYATKEAMLAKQRLGNAIECSVFIMDERAFNKEYSQYFAKAREQHAIQYIRCRVSRISEDPLSNDLILHFADSDGTSHTQRFEMVVLATGLQPPESAHQLAELFDIELNEFGFCQTDKYTPLQTSRPGVFVCGAFSSPKEIAETIIDASGAAAEVMRLLNDHLNTYRYSREWPFHVIDGHMVERDVRLDEPRVGVFACTCGMTISEVLDMASMVRDVRTWQHVVTAEVVDFACFPEVVEQLAQHIVENELNRVVITGCSNRTHDSLFQRMMYSVGLNPYYLELVNLREQCAMVHGKNRHLANRKALELMRVAVGRVLAAQPVHKDRYECYPAALVIGGGVAGLTTALAIADSGFDVHLVERAEMLGGNLLNIYYVAEGYDPQRLLRDLVNRVRAHNRIFIHTRSEIIQHSGHVGQFTSIIRTRLPNDRAQSVEIQHGVTIVATGGQEMDSHQLLELPRVITQQQLEEKIIHRPAEIAALTNVVMIQCMRPDGVADYCSRVCCTNAMKNAIRLKLFNPGCNVTVLFKNIVTYGFREKFYTEARRLGVVFVRYTDEEPPEIITDGDQLHVRIRDLTLNRYLELPADLVTLSMTIAPSKGADSLAEVLRVPLSSERFFEEAQVKLRPMDFMRDGIFLAGMAHYPKFIEETISHALAASARALPLLAQKSLHLGGVVAKVDPQKCVGCLTCTRVCPFSIPRVIEQEDRAGVGNLGGAAYIDPAQCQGCGTCTGECPASAIQLMNYSDEQVMLKSIGGLGSWLPVAEVRS